MNPKNTVEILNIPFQNMTNDQFIEHIKKEHLHKNNPAFIITANPEIVMFADQNEEYKQIVLSADYIIPDGIGIIYASNIIGQALPERIAGFDLMNSLLAIAAAQNKSVFFYGAKPEIIGKAVNNILASHQNLTIAGYEDGYSTPPDQVAALVQKANPDFLFIGTGFPRQEQWIHAYQHLFPTTITMGVGGSFDVLSGETKRAPSLFIKLNLEWFYRLLTQPHRIIRMLALPKFLIKIIKTKFLKN